MMNISDEQLRIIYETFIVKYVDHACKTKLSQKQLLLVTPK